MDIRIIDLVYSTENPENNYVFIVNYISEHNFYTYGWLFNCLLCGSLSSRLVSIKTKKNNGIVKTIICKDCKIYDYTHSDSFLDIVHKYFTHKNQDDVTHVDKEI